MTHILLGLVLFASFPLTCLYPWHPRWPGARWLVHVPWLQLVLWAGYEWSMPGHMNIRLDIPIIAWGIGLSWMIYVFRLVGFWWWKRSTGGAASR